MCISVRRSEELVENSEDSENGEGKMWMVVSNRYAVDVFGLDNSRTRIPLSLRDCGAYKHFIAIAMRFRESAEIPVVRAGMSPLRGSGG